MHGTPCKNISHGPSSSAASYQPCCKTLPSPEHAVIGSIFETQKRPAHVHGATGGKFFLGLTRAIGLQIAFHVADDGVRFAIELQEALMKLDWHPRLLTHPAAATVTMESPAGPVTVFRGLRVRAVLNTGRPLRIEVGELQWSNKQADGCRSILA